MTQVRSKAWDCPSHPSYVETPPDGRNSGRLSFRLNGEMNKHTAASDSNPELPSVRRMEVRRPSEKVVMIEMLTTYSATLLSNPYYAATVNGPSTINSYFHNGGRQNVLFADSHISSTPINHAIFTSTTANNQKHWAPRYK